MKRNLLIAAAVTAAAAAGSIVAFGSGSEDPLEATSLPHAISNVGSSEMMKAPSKATAGYDMWITEVQSNFNLDTSFTYDQGPRREYGTEISIAGSKVKIKGLFDLWFDEVDKEYVIEGTYDQRSGVITIPVTPYDSEKNGIQGYVKAAEMYSLTTNEPYTLVVFAGNMDTSGSLNTIEGLTFNVNDDLDQITAKTGFGLYAFDSNGNPMAFYDYYRSAKMSLPQEGVHLSSSVEGVDFAGLFVCNGIEQKHSIEIFNRGSETAEVTVECGSPDISFDKTSAVIESCSKVSFMLTLNASVAGRVDEDVVFKAQDGEAVTVHVGVDVAERPDYTLITKNGADLMKFDMSPVYPFVIAEIDGRTVAVSLNEGDNTESWFTATVDIPKGKVGIFRFKGFQENKQPNYFAVSIDGNPREHDLYSSSYDPLDVSNTLILTEGTHKVGFSHVMTADWYEYTGERGRAYVYDLDLLLTDKLDNAAVHESEIVRFEDAFFDGLSTTRESFARLHNIGSSPLEVTGAESDGNIEVKIPTREMPHGTFIDVPMIWTVDAVGDMNAVVTLHTSAGDIDVMCEGHADAIPAEFHNIVTEGTISFDTDSNYPFIYNSKRNYLYNCTSQSEKDKATDSWLEASFEVPDGSVGKLYWDAYNDSEDSFIFMDIPYIISGSTFTIDGGTEKSVGGTSVHCASSDMFTPGELIMQPGRHTVRYNYKKTTSDPAHVFGDDRMKLYEIGVQILSNEDMKGYVTPETCDFKGMQYSVERDGHQSIGIVNCTDTPFELYSWEAEGPFSVVDLSDYSYENTYPMMVEYHPTKTGVETGCVILHTSIGDYSVECKGNGIDLQRGGRVYYESFEYGDDDWLLEDYDNDGESWIEMSELIYTRENKNASIPYGYRAMGAVLYDYYSNNWKETPVDDAIFSPEIEIPAEGKTLLQFLVSAKTYDSEDALEVLIGEDADTYIDMYEPVFEKNLMGSENLVWHEYMVDLSKYAGKIVNIAFRVKSPKAFNSYFYMIDDVLVTNSLVPSASSSVSLPQADGKAVVSTEYISPEGLKGNVLNEGLNILLVRHEDGSITTSKVMHRSK